MPHGIFGPDPLKLWTCKRNKETDRQTHTHTVLVLYIYKMYVGLRVSGVRSDAVQVVASEGKEYNDVGHVRWSAYVFNHSLLI